MLASSIWNRLAFTARGNALVQDELNALWELVGSNSDVKAEFLAELQRLDGERVERLGRRPLPVLRAMFLRWPPQQAEAVFALLMGAVKSDSGSKDLVSASQALIGKLTSAQAATALTQVIGVVRLTTESDQLEALGSMAGALARQITGASADSAAAAVMAAMEDANPGQEVALGFALAGLAEALVERVDAGLRRLISVIDRTTAPDELDVLRPAAEILASKLPAATAVTMLWGVLDTAAQTTDPDQLAALGSTATALAGRVSDAHVSDGLEGVLAALTRSTDVDQLATFGLVAGALTRRLPTPSRVLSALGNTEDPDRLVAVALALQGSEPKLLAADRATAITRVVRAISITTDPDRLRVLGSTALALVGDLSSPQAAAELSLLVGHVLKSDDSDQLDAFKSLTLALAQRITLAQADVAVRQLVVALGATTDPGQLGAVAAAAETLPQRLTAEQADAVLRRVLSMIGTTTDGDQLEALGTTAKALALSLSPARTSAVLRSVIDAIRRSVDPDQLSALGETARALAERTTTAEADATLALLVASIGRASDSNQLGTLGAVAGAVTGHATSLEPVIAAQGATNDPDHLLALGLAMEGTEQRLTPAQTIAALGPLIRAMGYTTDPDDLEILGPLASALASQLTPEKAGMPLAAALKAIEDTTDPDQLRALGSTAEALARRLTMSESEPVLLRQARVAIEGTTDADQLTALGSVAVALAGLVSPKHADTEYAAALAAVEETTDPDQLEALSSMAETLAPTLTAPYARTALERVSQAARRVSDSDQREALALMRAALDARGQQGTLGRVAALVSVTDPEKMQERMGPLAKELTPAEAAEALRPFVIAIGSTTAPIAARDLAAMSETLVTLTSKLDTTQKEAAVSDLISLLAWSRFPDVTIATARTVIAVMPRQSPERFVGRLAELLKYPSVAGPATDEILEAIRAANPSAPGKQASIERNVEWLARTYPSITLDAPPACPPPLWPRLACPSGS